MQQEDRKLADDLLIGAAAIAEELDWKRADGQWDARRVYHVASKGTVPIHHVKGLGLCARRSSLAAFFATLDARYIKRIDKESSAK